jgi:hypothetical protein
MGKDLKRWIAAACACLRCRGGACTHAQTLDEALDAPARAHVVNEYARRLTAQHVDPARAKAAADDLRQRLARGEYDQQTTARALAARVSRDVAAIMGDKHTYLEYVPYDLGDERQRPRRRRRRPTTTVSAGLKRAATTSAICKSAALRRWTVAPARPPPVSWRKRPTAPP